MKFALNQGIKEVPKGKKIKLKIVKRESKFWRN